LRANDSASLDITGELTLEAWIYPLSTGEADQRIVQKRIGNNDILYGLLFDDDGDLEFRTQQGTDSDTTDSIGQPSLDHWHHVAVTYEDSANRVRFYIDGAYDSGTTTFDGHIGTNNDTVDIGGVRTRNARGFRGTIDEVRISSVARPADWIAAQHLSHTDAGFVVYGVAEIRP
jgi:hypothetical protein